MRLFVAIRPSPAVRDVLLDAEAALRRQGRGTFTRPENLPLLRQNSVTVLLHRPIEDLPTDGRPMSQLHGKAALYEKRKPLYESWGEVRIECCGVDATAQAIREALGL